MTVLIIGYGLAAFCCVTLAWCACKLAGDADRRSEVMWQSFQDRPHDNTEADRLSVDEFIEAMGWVNEPATAPGEGVNGLVHIRGDK